MSQYINPQAEAMKKFEPKRIVAAPARAPAPVASTDNIADTPSRQILAAKAARDLLAALGESVPTIPAPRAQKVVASTGTSNVAYGYPSPVVSNGCKITSNSVNSNSIAIGSHARIETDADKVVRLYREVKQLEAKLATVQELYTASHNENSELKSQVTELSEERDNIVAQLITIAESGESSPSNDASLVELSEQLNTEIEKSSVLTAENCEYAERAKILESRVAELENALSKRTAAEESIRKEYNTQRDISSRLRRDLDAANEKNRELEDKLQTLSSQYAAMDQAEFDSITAQLINENEKNGALEADLQFLKAKRESIKRTLAERTHELETVKTRLQEQTEYTAGVETQLDEARDEIKTLTEAAKQNVNLRGALKVAESKVRTVENDLAHVKSEHKALQTVHAGMSTKNSVALKNAIAEKAQLQSELNSTKSELAASKVKFDTAATAFKKYFELTSGSQ